MSKSVTMNGLVWCHMNSPESEALATRENASSIDPCLRRARRIASGKSALMALRLRRIEFGSARSAMPSSSRVIRRETSSSRELDIRQKGRYLSNTNAPLAQSCNAQSTTAEADGDD